MLTSVPCATLSPRPHTDAQLHALVDRCEQFRGAGDPEATDGAPVLRLAALPVRPQDRRIISTSTRKLLPL